MNLDTHGIADKAPYLSEAIALRLLFLLFLVQLITSEYITPTLIPVIMQFPFKLASNRPYRSGLIERAFNANCG